MIDTTPVTFVGPVCKEANGWRYCILQSGSGVVPMFYRRYRDAHASRNGLIETTGAAIVQPEKLLYRVAYALKYEREHPVDRRQSGEEHSDQFPKSDTSDDTSV